MDNYFLTQCRLNFHKTSVVLHSLRALFTLTYHSLLTHVSANGSVKMHIPNPDVTLKMAAAIAILLAKVHGCQKHALSDQL